MNNDLLNKYHIKIDKIKYLDDNIIIYSNNKMYLLKIKSNSIKELFDYFESIHYPYYLDIINDYDDYYEIYPYYEDITSDLVIKGKEIIKAIQYLHMNSLYYEDILLDDLKKIYENILNEIDYLIKYYLDLQDYIESFSFPRVDYYFLIKNISNFYNALYLAREKVEGWYREDNLRVRKVFNINNVSLNNFRINDKSYFIDYSLCKKDLIVYDFVSFYKNNSLDFDMIELFDIYNSKINLTIEEFNLLCSLILIPGKINFTDNIYNNTLYIRKKLEYIEGVFRFVLEEDKKYQETDENEFKE